MLRRISSLALLIFAVLTPSVSAQSQLTLCVCSVFYLTSIGQITDVPSEVISGTQSIKGSYSGSGSYTPYLRSNPAVLQLTPGDTYRITFSYRILVTPSRGFETLFYSPIAGQIGNFLPSVTITGTAGTTGTQTLTNTLGQFPDYEARWNIVGTGAISIDDIQILDVTTGQVVASENAEPSPITNLQPASTLLPAGTHSLGVSFNTAQSTSCRYSVGESLSYDSMFPLDSGPPASSHGGIIGGLSSDPRVLNRVYIRCAAYPDISYPLVYRSVATPRGSFPRIGTIWTGDGLYQSKPAQAQRAQLYLGPNGLSATDATALRSADPDVLILPSIQLDDTWDTTLPETYYLHDTHGNRISDWCSSDNIYVLNATRPEVSAYLGQLAYNALQQSNWAFDGIFFDSFGTTKPVSGTDCHGNPFQVDANNDGQPDDQATLNAAWAAGEYLAVKTFHNLVPGAYVAGHVGEWPAQPSSLSTFNGTSIVFDAVNVREGLMAFDPLRTLYQTWESQAVAPAITMVQSSPPNQLGYGYGYYPATSMLPSTAAFAQGFYPNVRFGLGLALLDDGFFTYDFGDATPATLDWWYDEYDFNLGFPTGPAAKISYDQFPNLINNSDFDHGLTGWQLNVAQDGQGRATVTADGAAGANGTSTSARINVTSAATINWHIELEQDNLPLISGTEYQVQFWARADSPRVITVMTQGGAPNYPNYGLFVQISIGTTWTQYSATFAAPATANDGRLEFWVGDVVGTVWLGGVQLTQVPPEIYRRDFTNGVVMLNGTNQPQTISLEPGLTRFTGKQAPLYQYIVDDSMPAFNSTGSWNTVSYNTGAYSAAGSSATLPSEPQNEAGPYYHAWLGSCHELDAGVGTAQWNLNIPADGQYTIQIWLPAAPKASTWTTAAVYEVVSGGSVVASVVIDQTIAAAGDGWHTVGTVNLTVAGRPYLRIHSEGTGPLIADAVYVASAARYNDGSPASVVTLQPMDAILLQLATSVPGPAGNTAFNLFPGRGISIASSGTASAVSVGYGALQPNVASATPAGVAIFDFRRNNVLVSEVGVPATPALSSGRIYAEISAAVDTGVAIANPSATAATVNFYFTDTAGNNVGAGTFSIPPNDQISEFLDQAPFKVYATSTFTGSLTFNSNVPIAVVALRGFTNERGDFLMSSLPVIDTTVVPAAGTAVIPHFADGGGWTTQLMLVNPADQMLTGKIQFLDSSGQPSIVDINGQSNSTFIYSVASRSSRSFVTAGTAAVTASGSIQVVPDNGGVSPIPLVLFSYKPNTVTVSVAGVPPVTGNDFQMYVESFGVGQTGVIQSGLAVANTAAVATTVTFSVTDLNGTAVAGVSPVSVVLPSSGQIAKFLSDLFPSLPDSFKGILRITSASSPLSTVGLRTRVNERGDFLITTTPPAASANPPRGNLYFPQIVDGGGYTTQFILFSAVPGQPSSGAVIFVGQDGIPMILSFP